MFNDISYKAPIVPTLLTALSVPSNYSTEATVYGRSTNPFVLGHNNMVQIVLNNGDAGKHPCTSSGVLLTNDSPPSWSHFSGSL